MKIGNCVSVTGDVGAAMRRMRELGYNTADVQLNDVEAPWYHDTALMEKLCAHVREEAEAAGLELFQMHGPWPTDDSDEHRSEAWDYFHRAVYACHLLGARHMILHPQMPFGRQFSVEPDADAAEEITVGLLKDLIPDCEKYHVVVCLENMPFPAQRISTMEYIVRAVEKANSPWIGVCLDTGHVNIYENASIKEAVHIAAPHLKTLHVHDNNGRSDLHMLPYTGTLDWDAFTTALAEIGYNGSLSLETNGPVTAAMPLPVRARAEELTAQTAKYLAS